MTTTVTMRRSCHFCRLRKIRCSGQTICSACRERNIDCVYEVETAKGRPRTTSRKAAKASSRTGSTPEPNTSQTNISSNSSEQASKPAATFPLQVPDIASDMERMFNEVYGDEFPTVTGSGGLNPYQQGLRNFNRHILSASGEESSLDLSEDFPKEGIPETMNYHRLLGSISYEMVEMLANRFGHLGCELLGDVQARFFTRSLARDRTPAMFDPIPVSSPPPSADTGSGSSSSASSTTSSNSWSPRSQRLLSFDGCDLLGDLDYHKAVQLTDVWFSAHPLSCIVSKTLFLRSLRSNEKRDEILLAIILADATDIHADKSVPCSKVLFNWAASRLRHRPSKSTNLSTAQALTLLGWYELCRSRMRRAICYLGYAGRMIQKMKQQMMANEKDGLNHGVQVNGVSELDVEKELMLNIYWLTFSLTLWAFMQMDQPFLNLLPALVPACFPPVDENDSIVIALDIASDNVSTLQSQRRSIRELWPISNITSTVSHIYALYPRDREASEAVLNHGLDWQSRSLHQLRRLISQPQDLYALCVKIRLILVSASDSLSSAVQNVRSKAVVLTVLHSIVVHMLFPRAPGTASDGDEGEPPVVTGEVLNNFILSAGILLEFCGVIISPDRGSSDEFITSTHARVCSAFETVILALDACSRAMSYFLLRMQEGSLTEENNVGRRKVELLNLALQLYEFSKTEALVYPGSRLRVVRKSLKRAIEGLRNPGRSLSAPSICDSTTDLTTSSRPSSGRNSRQPSTTRSRSTISAKSHSPSVQDRDLSAAAFQDDSFQKASQIECFAEHHQHTHASRYQPPHTQQSHHQSIDQQHVPNLRNFAVTSESTAAGGPPEAFNVSDMMNLDFEDATLFENMNWLMPPASNGGANMESKFNQHDFMMSHMMNHHIHTSSHPGSGDVSPFQEFDSSANMSLHHDGHADAIAGRIRSSM